MKPSPNFKKQKKPKEKPLADALEEYRDKIVELGVELETLRHDLDNKVKLRLQDGAEDAKNFITKVARDHLQQRDDRLLRRMYEFLKLEIFWEHQIIYGSSVSAAKVEELTRQGYTYVQTLYNPEEKDVTRRHGCLYRRPKLPGTYDEFREMYDKHVFETKESKKKREEEQKRRKSAAEQVDAEVAKAERKKRKLAKKKAKDKADD